MSSKHTAGGGPPAAEDILASYLNDLLSEDLLATASETAEPRPSNMAPDGPAAEARTNGSENRVVSFITKKPFAAPQASAESPGTLAPLNEAMAFPVAASLQRRPPETKPSDTESSRDIERKLKLEKLLRSARAQAIETPVVVTQTTSPKTLFANNPDEIQEWIIESAPASANAPAVNPFQLADLEWGDNGRPVWAQSRFDVLLLDVAGLTLAVPLISLGQIQPLTHELTPLFGQAEWFMGLQPTPAGKIRTVNTAKFVMPERYDDAFLKSAKYVVSINGVPWGLAVDSVNQPITLNPENVKWRGNRSKRPWLAGTVKEHMCALLDIPRIGQMLIDADKNFSPPVTTFDSNC